ncbi:MAG: hypothetical protein LBF60_03255 [Treponema sp.]|jgi:hypothetical protein|nr:hypothetical protein [Treponema sp.]
MYHTIILSLNERLDLGIQVRELKKQGKLEEAAKLARQMSLPPYKAKWAKKRMGADFRKQGNWNLSEAESEYDTGKYGIC